MKERLTKTWEVSAFDRVNNEWTTTLNHAYDNTPEATPDMFITQAPPHKIYTTRRIKPERAERVEMFYGDSHHPFQRERVLDLAQLAIKEYSPDGITFLGDDNDMAMFSRFETRNEWLDSTQKGIDQFSDRLAKVRADAGKEATITAIQGNHDLRLEKQIRKFNGELLGIRRPHEELSVLSLEFLLRCAEIGVEYVDGYPEAEKWYGDNLKAYHGRKTSSTGAIVAQEIKGETVNFIHGHGHSNQYVERTFRDGRELKTIFGMQLGAIASQETPSGSYSQDGRGNVLRQAQNWQPGLAVAFIIENEVFAQFIPVNDERIILNGKRYKS